MPAQLNRWNDKHRDYFIIVTITLYLVFYHLFCCCKPCQVTGAMFGRVTSQNWQHMQHFLPICRHLAHIPLDPTLCIYPPNVWILFTKAC